jgi:GGDEF domain-containing protein
VEPAAGAPGFGIKPHFHETGVFYALVSALALAILYAAWRSNACRTWRSAACWSDRCAERTQELHAANMQLEHASQADLLTGLRNRRYLANQVPVDLSYYAREQARVGADAGERTLLFALVDIDRFQRINDEHGLRAGDKVLQQFAQLMLRMVRTGDYVVRWGGENSCWCSARCRTGTYPRSATASAASSTSTPSTWARAGADAHLLDRPGRIPALARGWRPLGWEQVVELAEARWAGSSSTAATAGRNWCRLRLRSCPRWCRACPWKRRR